MRLHPLPVGALVSAIALAGLYGCLQKTAPSNPGVSLDAFMARNYGTPSPSKGIWTDSGQNIHRPCAKGEVSIQGNPHLLLAVCTDSIEASNATSGSVDLYVLRGTWDAFTVAAETTSIASGSNGHPGKVVVLHLGKEFFGFEMSDDYIGQGEYQAQAVWFAPSRTGIRRVLWMTSVHDMTMTNECSEDSTSPECFSESRRASIDSSDPARKTFPVDLYDTLRRPGDTTVRKHRIEFEPSKWSYPEPKMISEGKVPQ